MKKILFLMGVVLISFSSCFELDNWEEPDCIWRGTVIDSYTNEPLLSSQNDWQIRIWERSWTGLEGGASNFQDLRIKQDGTYQNTKLFAGTYDMLPYNGPFWPMDTIKNLELKKALEHNFTVIPYIQIVDYKAELISQDAKYYVKMSFKVKAPLLEKDGKVLPRLYEMRPFLSLTPYCGNGADSSIGVPEYNDYVRIRPANNSQNSWATLISNGAGDNTTPTYEFGLMQVKKGYTYYVRAGASVDDTYRRHVYSPIVKIEVPNN